MRLFDKIRAKMDDVEMKQFYLKGGRKKTIDRHFGGVERADYGFNSTVLDLWRKDKREKRTIIVFSVILPIIISFRY